MSDSRLSEWEQLVDFSRMMLEKAEAGEWETLSQLAAERQRRLESFFAQPVPEALAGQVAEGIRRIQEIDALLASKARGAGKTFAAEHETLQKRKLASRAYADSGKAQR